MAEESHPIKTLTAARDRLVEERRSLAGAIALGYRRRRTDDVHTNDMRETFLGIQNTIEAIERAITHEKVLESGNPGSYEVPTLVPSGSGLAGIN
jgi:hypothetical protein